MKQTFREMISQSPKDSITESKKEVDKELQKIVKYLEKLNYNMKEPVDIESDGIFELIFDLTDARSVKEYAKEAAMNSYDDDGDLDVTVRDDWETIADNAQKVAEYNQAQMKVSNVIKAIKSVK